jgi:hypothetical protein
VAPRIDAIRDPRQSLESFAREQAQKLGLPIDAIVAGLVRGPGSVPTTRVRLTHAYTLRTGKNRVVGAVFRTAIDQARQIDREFEVDLNAVGEVADLVPQQLTSQTITIARWDLYDTVFEEVFQNGELSILTDQRAGFKLREFWRAPYGILNAQTRRYEYSPCWFSRLGRVQEATGDRTVRADAALEFMNRDILKG